MVYIQFLYLIKFNHKQFKLFNLKHLHVHTPLTTKKIKKASGRFICLSRTIHCGCACAVVRTGFWNTKLNFSKFYTTHVPTSTILAISHEMQQYKSIFQSSGEFCVLILSTDVVQFFWQDTAK